MRWTVSVEVDAPQADVLGAIADEHVLMQWSAWPEATGYSCAVDGDGTSVGSQIVFTDPAGVEQGRQTLTSVSADRVEYRLRNRGPAGRTMTPEIDFRLEAAGPRRTVVHLDFRAEVPLPAPLRQLAERFVGRRVRALHVEDLRRLKAQVEGALTHP